MATVPIGHPRRHERVQKESWVGDAQNSDIILNASASLTFILFPTHPQFPPNFSNLFTWLHLYHNDSSPSDCHVPPGLSVVTLLPFGWVCTFAFPWLLMRLSFFSEVYWRLLFGNPVVYMLCPFFYAVVFSLFCWILEIGTFLP